MILLLLICTLADIVVEKLRNNKNLFTIRTYIKKRSMKKIKTFRFIIIIIRVGLRSTYFFLYIRRMVHFFNTYQWQIFTRDYGRYIPPPLSIILILTYLM